MHPEVLDQKRQDIFSYLAEFRNFYIAGGTALAMQIGHRISVDFDLFSKKEISKNLLPKVKKIFTGKKIIVSVNNMDELTVFIDSIKVTFLRYPFPIILDLIKYKKLSFLSVPEIAATKAYTIGRRGSYKDYVDFYFIIKGKYTCLNNIVDLAEKKYKDEFNGRLFLEQLIYLKDIQDEKILFLKEKISRKELEKFLKEEIKKFSL